MGNKKDFTEERQEIVATPAVTVPQKSKKKMHFKEFMAGKNLRREFIAGFKMYLNGVEYLTKPEWEKIYNDYIHRK